jgi:hypothetical protein
MILVLVLLAVSVLLGASYLSTASIQEAAASAHADMLRARYLAESGIQHGLCLLTESPSALAGTDVTPLGPIEIDSSHDAYRISARPAADPTRYELTCSAVHGRSRQAITATVVTVGRYHSLVMAEEPVGYWRMGDKAGAVAANVVATGNGLYVNSPTLNAAGALIGDVDGAVQFDGGWSYAVIPHHAAFLLNSGAIQFWYRNSGGLRNEGVFSKDSDGRDTGGHLSIWIDHRKVRVRLSSARHTYTVQSGNLETGAWYLVTFTFGDAGMKLYVNGGLVHSDPYNGGLGPNSGGAGNFQPIVLGACAESSHDLVVDHLKEFYSGLLDEVAIYGHALSQEQIAAMYAARGSVARIESWQE